MFDEKFQVIARKKEEKKNRTFAFASAPPLETGKYQKRNQGKLWVYFWALCSVQVVLFSEGDNLLLVKYVMLFCLFLYFSVLFLFCISSFYTRWWRRRGRRLIWSLHTLFFSKRCSGLNRVVRLVTVVVVVVVDFSL